MLIKENEKWKLNKKFICVKNKPNFIHGLNEIHKYSKKIDSTYFDEPFRALFQKINPVFDCGQTKDLGRKLTPLLVGAHGVDDDKKPEKGVEKFISTMGAFSLDVVKRIRHRPT